MAKKKKESTIEDVRKLQGDVEIIDEIPEVVEEDVIEEKVTINKAKPSDEVTLKVNQHFKEEGKAKRRVSKKRIVINRN